MIKCLHGLLEPDEKRKIDEAQKTWRIITRVTTFCYLELDGFAEL